MKNLFENSTLYCTYCARFLSFNKYKYYLKKIKENNITEEIFDFFQTHHVEHFRLKDHKNMSLEKIAEKVLSKVAYHQGILEEGCLYIRYP